MPDQERYLLNNPQNRKYLDLGLKNHQSRMMTRYLGDPLLYTILDRINVFGYLDEMRYAHQRIHD